MVAMAEELGLEMAIRSLEHLLQYGEQNIRRAVPLALGLLCISNPKVCINLYLVKLIEAFYKTKYVPFPFGNESLTIGWYDLKSLLISLLTGLSCGGY